MAGGKFPNTVRSDHEVVSSLHSNQSLREVAVKLEKWTRHIDGLIWAVFHFGRNGLQRGGSVARLIYAVRHVAASQATPVHALFVAVIQS